MSASFWQTVAVYCNHLAPVAGPVISSIGGAANAIHNAECETRQLERDIQYFKSIGPSNELD